MNVLTLPEQKHLSWCAKHYFLYHKKFSFTLLKLVEDYYFFLQSWI